MDKVKETQNTVKNEIKKRYTILGFSVWKLFAYFIIYSIVGFIIETVFGAITKGTIESRQSFLYGPFCSIYGIGAVIMIVFLQYFKKNYNTLFIGGFIIGSITEYLISLFGESILNVKWWDYSNMPLNIGGRICVYFSVFWGFLAIYLICSFNPRIDKIIGWVKRKIPIKYLKIITLIMIIFLFLDCIVTGYAIKMFQIRMVAQHDLNIKYKEETINAYNRIYSDSQTSNFIYKFFGDKKMIRTFPNLKIMGADGNMIYFDSLLPDIQPYYYKMSR